MLFTEESKEFSAELAFTKQEKSEEPLPAWTKELVTPTYVEEDSQEEDVIEINISSDSPKMSEDEEAVEVVKAK